MTIIQQLRRAAFVELKGKPLAVAFLLLALMLEEQQEQS